MPQIFRRSLSVKEELACLRLGEESRVLDGAARRAVVDARRWHWRQMKPGRKTGSIDARLAAAQTRPAGAIAAIWLGELKDADDRKNLADPLDGAKPNWVTVISRTWFQRHLLFIWTTRLSLSSYMVIRSYCTAGNLS